MILECITLMCIAGLDGGGNYVPAPRQEIRKIERLAEQNSPVSPEIISEPEPPAPIPKPVGGVWERLAVCESGMNGVPRWDYNGNSGFDGGIQFHPGTWTAYKPSDYPDYAWQATPYQQIQVGRVVAEDQGAGAWPSCTAKLGIDTWSLVNG